MPLFHPRKNQSPGSIYAEWRAISALRTPKHPRYPFRFRRVEEVKLIDMLHVRLMGTDVVRICEIANVIGFELLEEIQGEAKWRRERDADTLRSRYLARANYLFRRYSPPTWP